MGERAAGNVEMLDDDPAQSGMGMGKAPAAQCNQEVMLPRSGPS